jgi:hypothetical protein
MLYLSYFSSIGSDVIALSFDQTITLEKNITITFERNKQVRKIIATFPLIFKTNMFHIK